MIGYVINLDTRHDRMESFNKNEFPFEVIRIPGILTKTGQEGCAMSHINVLKNHTELPFAVFEDDCKMLYPWEEVQKCIDQLPRYWDALWLGATLKKHLIRYSHNLCKLRMAYALHAVIYNSQRIVDYILENYKISAKVPIDNYYRHVVMERFRCYITYPMMATQEASVSDITGEYVDYGDYMSKQYKKYTS
jgi:hypothetical protein